MIILSAKVQGKNLNINPIDVTETFATKMNLHFSRIDDNEISIQLKDEKPEYILSVIFKSDYEIIYFSCDMNLRVPKEKYFAITDALVKANERIWVGHFDLISIGNRIVYSLTIPFVSSFSADEEVIESIIQLVKDECNQFYHYFSMIIENKKLPTLPSNAIFLESAGEA
ncbi:MAG: YbjN domain-containing protein [Holosporaceae bacterium]|nr:YbjN domain-containing protein [Holosporaceae bacterium]